MSKRIRQASNQSEAVTGFLLILPALSLFSVFYVYSFIQAIRFALMDWSGVGEQTFVGLQNFLDLLNDGFFWQAHLNNWYYAIGILAFGMLPGLGLAYLLSLPRIRGRTLFRSVFFFPRIVSAVVYGIVWVWIYDPRRGLVKLLTEYLQVDSVSVLGNPELAMLGIVITGGWTYFGFCMVVFLSAFMGVDRALSESALIDGASGVQIFWRITLPQIRPVINMMIMYTVIDSFKVYDLVLIMTSGGPNNATQIMTYYIYKQAFQMNRYGYGSASAIMLGVFMIGFAIAYNRMFAREEFSA